MKKLKSCIFLLLTVLFSASVFALSAVPPDNPYSESIQLPVISDQGEILDLDTDNDLPKNPTMKEDITVFSKVLSVDRGMKIEFNFLTETINRFAVVQNQNFDRMPSQS